MNATAGQEQIIPYRAWWGLAGCGLLMGIVMVLAPYHDFEILPRRHNFDYPWKLSDPTVLDPLLGMVFVCVAPRWVSGI